MRNPLLRGITLTDAEKANLKHVDAQHAAQMKALREQYKPQNEAMRAARQRGDTAAMRALWQKNQGEREQMRQLMLTQRNDVRGALSPANQAVFDANVAALEKHAANRAAKGKGRRAGLPEHWRLVLDPSGRASRRRRSPPRDECRNQASSYTGRLTTLAGADAACSLLAQTFPVLSFLGVVVQLGGVLMLIALFLTLRRFVLRRAYFKAWATAWVAFAVAISALVVRYVLVPGITGARLAEDDPITRGLYLVYQMSKGLGFIFFLRGTRVYIAGTTAGVRATRNLWPVAVLLSVASAALARRGLNEMVIWQCVIAIPTLGYCAWALLSLPRPRRTAGSAATGASFALLAGLWMAYAVGFVIAIRDVPGTFVGATRLLVSFNSYFDLTLNVLLGYSMILLLMEDAKREVDDAQAELRLTHDRLRRAALYDPLTDSLNRRAFMEGVGLEMVRATFGTVVIADLDNLKRVNDQYGHVVGDHLIRSCAEVLRSDLRPYDKLYRWGGDEFLLVLPSARSSNVIDRLRRAIEAAAPAAQGATGDPVRLQVSLGAADYASSEELARAIDGADRAMYLEKARRKNEQNHAFAREARMPTPARAAR